MGIFSARDGQIKADRAAGMSYSKLAKKYSLSPTRIIKIVNPERIQKPVPTKRVKIPPKADGKAHHEIATTRELLLATGADDLRRMLAEVGLSQIRLAKILGIGQPTVNAWANSRDPFPLYARRYLELLLAYRKDIKVIRDIRLEKLSYEKGVIAGLRESQSMSPRAVMERAAQLEKRLPKES